MKATCTLTAGKITSAILLNKVYGYAGGFLNVAVSGGGGAGAVITASLVYKGYAKTLENLTTFENSKKYRFKSILVKMLMFLTMANFSALFCWRKYAKGTALMASKAIIAVK
jgi:hypothetical protein